MDEIKNINVRLPFIDKIMETNDMLLTDIYVITNTITNKKYVGQANSHRLNHAKYRPFGYTRRLKDHISEAVCNTKKKQCKLLNNSIRKHGPDNFKVELIQRCLPESANDLEERLISEYKTLAPNGYNLSDGGRKGVKLHDHRVNSMKATMLQFADKKLAKYAGIKLDIDIDNIDQYIHEYEYDGYGGVYYQVKIKGIKSIFVGKLMTKDELKQQALDFVKKLHDNNLAT
jgi:hypothetical protein